MNANKFPRIDHSKLSTEDGIPCVLHIYTCDAVMMPENYIVLTAILRENQADSMESQFLGYLEISQCIRKSKVLMSKTWKTAFEEICHFLFFPGEGYQNAFIR